MLRVSAKPIEIVRFRSIIRTDDVDHVSQTTSEANGGGNSCGTAHLGARMPSTEAAVSQPWPGSPPSAMEGPFASDVPVPDMGRDLRSAPRRPDPASRSSTREDSP